MTRRRPWSVGVVAVVLALGTTAALSWLAWETGRPRLDSPTIPALCVLTETGSARLVPALLLLAFLVWLTDPAVPRTQRRRESLVVLVLMAVALPALAAFNEAVVKRAVRSPRPSHLRLQHEGILPDLQGFYRLDRDQRHELLRSRLPGGSIESAAQALSMHPAVLEHWIQETGSTFPSGHALNAFTAAVMALGVALAKPSRRRAWLAVALLGWAVAVALSRVLLQVHRPVDVVAGALAGSMCGAVLVLLWWRLTPSGLGVTAAAGAAR